MQSRISISRTANQQPTFDFLTGAGMPPRPSDSVLRERTMADHEEPARFGDHELADLRAEVKSLRYAIKTNEDEQELSKLRQDNEARAIRTKADEDFKRMQAAEGERLKAVRKYETLVLELSEIKTASSVEASNGERKLREAENGRRLAEEEVEDVKATSEASIRDLGRKLADVESQNAALRSSFQDLQSEVERREKDDQDLQQQIAAKVSQIGDLEGEVLRLKAQTGDAETLSIIKRELCEQVNHIRTLETANREQAGELKHLRRLHKSVEIVEEEKRTLLRRLDGMEDLQHELGEARLQRQRLEDEKLAWTAYLRSQASPDGVLEFDSPEAVMRALTNERLEAAMLLEKLGGLEPALAEKDAIINSLEASLAELRTQAQKSGSTGANAGDSHDAAKIRRMERQRTLAIKEVEYLRAQIKALDAEESTMELASFDEAKAHRVQELEDMVDRYRKEVQSLHEDFANAKVHANNTEAVGSKRGRGDEDDNEQLGQLLRKNRQLQDELNSIRLTTGPLQKELSVAQERLRVTTEHSRTRIVALRSNPTSDVEAVKMSTLAALRIENTALLSQLQSGIAKTETVPISALEASQRDVEEMKKAVAEKEKRMSRLKSLWGSKSLEFREGVNSLLGWAVEFIPNGKMKVSSLFYPSTDDCENSIVFDGENGTMKVSGGPRSLFALKIRDQIKFWVTGRGEIPCLLAALTLEFYEESTRAARH